MLTNFKDEDFETKIKNEDVSVIQFSAEWCGPCKALKPVMDKLSDEYKDKANFYYADVEDGGINTGSAAGIRGVPTVIIYKKGVEVDRKVGGVPESHMKEFLDKNIKSEIARRILSKNREKWQTIAMAYTEIDTLRDQASNRDDEEELKKLDEINEFIMSIEKKYEIA